jgi:hypothetical protein
VLGAGLAQVVPGGTVLRPVFVVGAGLALALALAVPLPRQVGSVEAVLRLQPGGDLRPLVMELTPTSAAEGADTFDVLSVQGGARFVTGLQADGPGRFRSSGAVPVAGSWKTVVRLHRGNEVMAVPVHLPADPTVEAPAVPAVPERRASFVDARDLLLREIHGGPPLTGRIILGLLVLVLAVWLVLLVRVVRVLSPDRRVATSRAMARPRP